MENMNQRDKYCHWIFVMTVSHIENSSCVFSIKCFLRVTLFEAHSQTFTQLDVAVYTSTDTSLTGVKMHFSKENKSPVT